MDLTLIAIIIGIVEGITEFLPISSTGHMIIVGHLLGFDGPVAKVFDIFVQLGSILSVIFLYRDKFRHFFTREGWQVNKTSPATFCETNSSNLVCSISGDSLEKAILIKYPWFCR